MAVSAPAASVIAGPRVSARAQLVIGMSNTCGRTSTGMAHHAVVVTMPRTALPTSTTASTPRGMAVAMFVSVQPRSRQVTRSVRT